MIRMSSFLMRKCLQGAELHPPGGSVAIQAEFYLESRIPCPPPGTLLRKLRGETQGNNSFYFESAWGCPLRIRNVFRIP
jgi:hypothetical protein